ncbi:MAG: hypothetical protein ABH872_03095 [Candidatus Omnitrophota bacterium]
MKNIYRLGDDLFIAVGFCSFVIGIVLKVLDIADPGIGVNNKNILTFSLMCLLFSIAISLLDLSRK